MPSEQPKKLKDKVKENLQFLVFFVIPIVACVIAVPYVVNPATAKSIHEKFHMVLLTRQVCEISPDFCAKYLENELEGLRVKHFRHFDLMFARHQVVERLEGIIVNIASQVTPIRTIWWLFRTALCTDTDQQEFVEIWQESITFVFAFFYSMLTHTISGLLVSKVSVFFVMGICMSLHDSWGRILMPLGRIFETSGLVA